LQRMQRKQKKVDKMIEDLKGLFDYEKE